MSPLTARTRVAGVIGDPVGHSLSPALHNAAFGALSLDWAYLAFAVPAGRGAAAVEAMRVLGLEGLNVTMPLKAEVAGAVDRCSSTAEALGAVNTVVRRGSAVVGESTDGDGFVEWLRFEQGLDPSGRGVVVLGAGGAARAVIRALADHGAGAVTVVARRAPVAASAAALAGVVGRVGAAEQVADADLVVNATPLGMAGRPGMPADASLLGPGQLVVDLVYDPALTPFLAAAGERGATVANGLGMLVHQAGLSFSLWTGERAPLEAMWAAVRAPRRKH